MTDIATLGLEVRSDQIKQATLDLRALPDAASAAERAADKLRVTTTAAGATSEEFSRRVLRNIDTLKFQADQLSRTSAEQERFTALRRAGVTAETAAGQAVTATVTALQAQRTAQQAAADATRDQAAATKLTEDNNRRAAAAVQSVVSALQFEMAQLNRTAAQRAQYAAVQRAGVAADSAEAKAIMAQVAALQQLQAAQTKAGGLQPFQKVNLGYQLNDVFTQLASGGSPLMVAAQQGPQITQIFGGLANTLKAIPTPALIAGAAAAAVAAYVLVLHSIAQMNDALDEQQRRFTTLLGSRDQASQFYRDIAKQASDTGTSIAATTENVVAFAKATETLGASRQNIVDVASSIEKLTQLSGATTQDSTAARGALAAMLSQSTINADRLATVLGTVPQIADKIAAGLGVSVIQLRLMAAQGDLTNKQVFDALLKQGDSVNAEFAQMPKSIGGSFQSIADDMGQVLQRFANLIPLVREYRDAIQLAAMAAKALNQATTPVTPMDKANNAFNTAYSDVANTQQLLAGNINSNLRATLEQRLGRQIGSVGSLADGFHAAAPGTLSDAFAQVQAAYDAMRGTDGAAAAKALDANLQKAVALAAQLDPISGQLKTLSNQATDVSQVIADLLSGKYPGLSGEQTADALQRLSTLADQLKDKIKNLGDATTQASRAAGQIAADRAIDDTPAGMAIAARTRQLLADPNNTSTYDQANSAARAELANKAQDDIKAAQDQAAAQDKITAATGRGTAAMIDAQVEVAKLTFQYQYFGAVVDGTAIEAINKYGDAVRQKLTGEAMASSINAAKQYTDELAGIAAQMKVVSDGAHAMRRAQAQAKADLATDGTGGLQMQVFNLQQKLTDKVTLDGLDKEIALTNSLAAAAGDVAKQKALQLDYDIKRAQEAAGPGAREAIALDMRKKALEDLNREAAEGLASLQHDNDLAQQQLDIIRSGAPDQAAQLAMLAKRNDLLKAGADLNDPRNQAAIVAAGQKARIDEQLQFEKDAADATKRTWSNAYDSIQSTGADALYGVMANVPGQSLDIATTMKNIFLRAFAEIAAAAVIRPIITPIFQAGAALGVIPQGVVPSATGSTGGFSFGGGGGGLGMPGGWMNSLGSSSSSGGWFGRQISGIGNWLNSPIFGIGGSVTPGFEAASVPTQWGDLGFADLSGAYGGLGGAAAPTGALGGLTWAQGIGGIASIGMGAMNAFSGKGTGSTIGGIAQMAGGVMMKVPGLQVPGMILSVLGGMGGLLDGGPKIPPMPGLGYQQGTIDFSNPLNPVGSGGYAGAANTVGQSVLGLISQAGGTGIAGKLYSGTFASGTRHTWDGQQWQGQDYTEANLMSPTGQVSFIGGTGQGMSPDSAAEALTAQIFRQDVLTGAIKGVSDTLVKVFTNLNTYTVQATKDGIDFANAYDKLGKAANPVKDSIDQLNQQFQTLSQQAATYGLSLDPVTAELKKQTTRTAQDFIDNMLDPLAVQMRALDDAQKSALASAEYINANVEGVYADTNKIVDYYGKQRLQLEDQYYSGAITNLQALIKSLTYGDLSNASPLTTMAGLQSDYAMTRDQALGGDVTAISNFSTIASQLATFGQQAYGSTADYEAIRQQIIADSVSVSGVAGSGGSTSSTAGAAGGVTEQQFNQFSTMMSQFAMMMTQRDAETANLKDQMAQMTAQLKRYTAAAKK